MAARRTSAPAPPDDQRVHCVGADDDARVLHGCRAGSTRIPTTVPSSSCTNSRTENPSRTLAPAAVAAFNAMVSRTVRQGAKAVATPLLGTGDPRSANGPRSKTMLLMAGQPIPAPHRAAPSRMSGDGVAGEPGPINDEHPVALASQQHRGRRACASGPTMIASYIVGLLGTRPGLSICARRSLPQGR